jgi:predicted permease
MNDQGLNYLAACQLNEGRTHQEALAELALLQPDYAALHQGESMKQLASQSLGIVGIKEWQTRTQRPMVMMLVIAVGVVLLIACMNSAWLFSARAIDRRSETAVRVALGAGYGRVARQILAESLLLTLMGGIVGIGITAWALPPLLSLSADALTWRADMDFAVIGGIVVLSVAVGMLCGLVPALKYARLDPIEALQAGSRRMASSRDAALTRRIMVVSEVTLCMVLIVTSGLLVRSLGSLHQVDTGFDPTNVITAQVSLDDATYRSREAVSLFYDRVIDNVRAHPDVVEAAVITNVPIDRGLNLPIVPPIPIAGLPIASVDWRYVTEGYFRAMGVQLRAGREFATSDQAESTPVAVVNEAFVARFLPEVNPLGLQVQLNRMMGLSDSREIVGVVANTLQQGLSTAPPPIMYVPVRQVPDPFIGQVHQFFPMSFVVRYRSGPTGFSEALNQAIRTVDARIPISRVRTMAQVIDDATGGARFQAVLFSVFGLVSVLMAITALGGSVLYAVMRRRRDIGIRLALGASVPGMLRTVVGENVALSAAGIAAGAAGAFMLRQALRPFLFGVTPTDLATYIGAGMMLFLVALAATVAAAAPVLRIDPARTLRVE